MKKKLIGLLLVLVFVASACLVACQDNSQAIIDSVVFDKNNAAVSSEFVLSAKAGDKTVTWTSNNPAVELVLSEDKTEYVAKINPPEDKQVVVTLTVSLGNAKKDFTVKVNPITADDIADEYLFPKNNATVVESFTLDTKATYKGKEATITWAVENDADKDYIEVKDGKCVVTVSSLNPEVTITGSFTYKGETVTRNYKFTVSMPMTHLEEIDYWYSNTGVGRDLKGYIVAIAETYPKYDKYISFYMLDEELNAGYYIYRLNIGTGNSTEAAKFVPGAYVVISGKINGTYNGLYETTNADGATWTFDDSKKINIDEHIYAIDNDILAGSPAERRHTGTLVSLTNWKVKSVAETPDTDGKVAALILEKEGKTVAVSSSKYMASFYHHSDDTGFTGTGKGFDANGQAVANLCKTYKVGDVVSVTGILSYYAEEGKTPASTNGIQILPRSAADVKKGTADAAGTTYDGVKVGTMLAKINETLTTSGLSGIVVSAKEATLPATEDGVTVAYKLCSSSNAVKLEGTKITVTPSKNEKVNVQVDLTCGTYTTTVFFTIESRLMTDAQIVEAEKTALDLDKKELTKAGSLNLVVEGQVYDGVTIDWALKAGSTLGKVENGKYTVGTLPEEDTEVVLVATIKRGQATATKEITVTVKAITYTVKKVAVADIQENKAYKLVFDNTELDKQLFAKNGINGFYIASTETPSESDDIYVENVTGGGVKLYFKDGANKVYIGACVRSEDLTKTSYNITLGGKVGTANGSTNTTDPDPKFTVREVWTITSECIKINLNPDGEANEAFIGTYGKNVTFSMSAIKYLAEGNYTAYLAEVVDKTPVTKADINNLQENKAYKLAMVNTQLDKMLYAQNGINGFYIASTEELDKADDIYVEKVAGGVKLYFKDGANKVYIGACVRNTDLTKTSYNITLGGKVGTANGSTSTTDPDPSFTVREVWTITAECVKMNLNPDGEANEAFIGTYGKNVTFSMSAISYLASGNYTAYLVEVKG